MGLLPQVLKTPGSPRSGSGPVLTTHVIRSHRSNDRQRARDFHPLDRVYLPAYCRISPPGLKRRAHPAPNGILSRDATISSCCRTNQQQGSCLALAGRPRRSHRVRSSFAERKRTTTHRHFEIISGATPSRGAQTHARRSVVLFLRLRLLTFISSSRSSTLISTN